MNDDYVTNPLDIKNHLQSISSTESSEFVKMIDSNLNDLLTKNKDENTFLPLSEEIKTQILQQLNNLYCIILNKYNSIEHSKEDLDDSCNREVLHPAVSDPELYNLLLTPPNSSLAPDVINPENLHQDLLNEIISQSDKKDKVKSLVEKVAKGIDTVKPYAKSALKVAGTVGFYTVVGFAGFALLFKSIIESIDVETDDEKSVSKEKTELDELQQAFNQADEEDREETSKVGSVPVDEDDEDEFFDADNGTGNLVGGYKKRRQRKRTNRRHHSNKLSKRKKRSQRRNKRYGLSRKN